MIIEHIIEDIELSRGESQYVWAQMESAKMMLDYKLLKRLPFSSLDEQAVALLERNGRTVPVWHIAQRFNKRGVR